MDSTRHHYAFRFRADQELLNDRQFAIETIVAEAIRGGATVLHEWSYQFEPHGVTAIAALAESHISIHTWPEEERAELDVFTCGDAISPHEIGRAVVERYNGWITAARLVDTSEL